jgi:hypothetical protein
MKNRDEWEMGIRGYEQEARRSIIPAVWKITNLISIHLPFLQGSLAKASHISFVLQSL